MPSTVRQGGLIDGSSCRDELGPVAAVFFGGLLPCPSCCTAHARLAGCRYWQRPRHFSETARCVPMRVNIGDSQGERRVGDNACVTARQLEAFRALSERQDFSPSSNPSSIAVLPFDV
jgi:hypothetical protein